MENKTPLWQLFLIFTKMGAFTIGGGYAMIPLIEQELTSRGLISKEDLDDVIVLAQSAPGLLAVPNGSIGDALYRAKITLSTGELFAWTFVIILLIAMMFTSFKDNPVVARIFQGVRPVAVALILVPAVNMAKQGCHSWWTWLLCAGTMFGVAFLKISPIWFILVTIAASAGISSMIYNRKKQ